ncbi:MAG TPA: AI-2E family transporter [Anaerolineales bacterium]|nr:AI-2E family transporter [Anaerolineales bacterium]HNQ94290.1 AI-2E family transporter [Anaerolineales bacterium]HNS60820.1 AI-2E family transporter [Anaerolineales bacterium]
MAQDSASSPRWGSTTKLLAGLVILGIVTFLINRFSNLITPLLIIFIFAYLLHPITSFISKNLGISWKASVNLLFLALLIILVGLLTLGGVGLVGQIQSLIVSVQEILTNLPGFISDLSGRVFEIGPFKLDMHTVDLQAISQQLLAYVQPLLGQTGNLLGTIAGGAAGILGWAFFILLVSYFVMSESSGLQRDLIKVDVPGYNEDFHRLGNELSRIWNAFLRGQFFIFTLAAVVFTILFSILGVKYAIGLAFMAGLAKFLPYIGPFITSTTIALVTFFQPAKLFGLEPLWYTVIVLVITSAIDNIIDNLITPRIMARALKVHPAAVLVTALIFANLLGIIGVVIAAPLLATVALLGRYITRKMFDLDPFPAGDDKQEEAEPDLIDRITKFFKSKFGSKEDPMIEIPKEPNNEQQPRRTSNRNTRRNR